MGPARQINLAYIGILPACEAGRKRAGAAERICRSRCGNGISISASRKACSCMLSPASLAALASCAAWRGRATAPLCALQSAANAPRDEQQQQREEHGKPLQRPAEAMAVCLRSLLQLAYVRNHHMLQPRLDSTLRPKNSKQGIVIPIEWLSFSLTTAQRTPEQAMSVNTAPRYVRASVKPRADGPPSAADSATTPPLAGAARAPRTRSEAR